MRNRAAAVLPATIILLALILPYPAAAQTMFAPKTTTTPQTTTPTNPTLMQQPVTTIRPQVGNGLISVRDSYGNPVSAATISITGNGPTVTQLTSAQGDASFSNLGVGQYSYIVQKEGYCFQNIPLSLNISTGTTTTSKYVLTKFGSAMVKVTYNGRPVPGVDVTASFPSSPSPLSASKTDAYGSTTISLPPNIIRFATHKAGYEDQRVDMNIPCGLVTIVPVAIKDFYLNYGRLITRVIVKDPYLGVLAGANVRVTIDSFPLSQTTNAEGFTDFNFLSTGNLIFSASMDGYTPNQGIANPTGGQSASVVYITLNKR